MLKNKILIANIALSQHRTFLALHSCIDPRRFSAVRCVKSNVLIHYLPTNILYTPSDRTMIRSNILARRIANANFAAAPLAASSLAATLSSSSSAADALVARYASNGASAASSVIVPSNPASGLSSRRLFSSDVAVATRLGSVLQREINEETEASAEYEGGLPPELAELRSAISSKWTIIEGLSGIGDSGGETGSGASVRMIRKKAGSKGAKIGIVFHCQDTEEDSNFDTDDLFGESKGEEEEEEEEPPQAVRFGVVVSKGGKTIVIQCHSGSELSVDNVTIRDGDMDKVLAGLAGGEGLHAALYQVRFYTFRFESFDSLKHCAHGQ